MKTNTHKGLPIPGYRDQSETAVDLVKQHKHEEERLLRHLDALPSHPQAPIDGRWLAVARTHFEQGYMALNRAVFQPARVSLPEDQE